MFQVFMEAALCLEDGQDKIDADGLGAHKWVHIWMIELFLTICDTYLLMRVIILVNHVIDTEK